MGIPKHLRLKRQLDINDVFATRDSVKAYPLRLVFRKMPVDATRPWIRVGFVASKRSFRRAHDRNFIKRRMREAVRCDIASLEQELSAGNMMLDAMLIFTGRDLPDSAQIATAWKKLRFRLIESLATGF